MFYALRRVPPWFVVVVVGGLVILGLTALASGTFGGASPVEAVAAPPSPNASNTHADPAESSRSSAAAQNSADQIAFLAAAAKVSSVTASNPVPIPSSSAAARRTTTAPTSVASTQSPTPSPTESALAVGQSCQLSTQEVVAVYDRLDKALTNNDAVNQGLLLAEQVADFEIIAFYTPDQGAAVIAIELANATADLQATLLSGDSHVVTTSFAAKVSDLQNYCGSTGS